MNRVNELKCQAEFCPYVALSQEDWPVVQYTKDQIREKVSRVDAVPEEGMAFHEACLERWALSWQQ